MREGGQSGARDANSARELSRRRLPRMMFDFIDGATGSEIASALNQAALQRVKLQSRVLIDVTNLDLSTRFLGTTFDRPFGFAPMGMCNLIDPSADAAMYEQSAARNIPCCVSTAASTSLEESGRATGGRAWFQLYAASDSTQTGDLVDRARNAGYETLVFTVDTPRLSRRVRDEQNGFTVPFRLGPRQVLDFALHPRWSLATLAAGVPKPMNFEQQGAKNGFNRGSSRGGVDWGFLDRLRESWPGKLIVKGVMSPDDALGIRAAGADAVYVSNHGGRQLDSSPATIEALPLIRDALGPDYPLIFDSGVRGGDDIVRALALGASFVMLGRPVLYALGAGGGRGLKNFLDGLEEDLRSVMAQIGAVSVDRIDQTRLAGRQRGDHD